MMPNDRAKNIWIKELEPEDRKMLKKLREALGTGFNSVAVMKAAYGYFDHLAQIEKLKSEALLLSNQVHTLNQNLEHTKGAIREYFDFQKNTEANNEKHLDTLRKLSNQKAILKGGKSQGLSQLI